MLDAVIGEDAEADSPWSKRRRGVKGGYLKIFASHEHRVFVLHLYCNLKEKRGVRARHIISTFQVKGGVSCIM